METFVRVSPKKLKAMIDALIEERLAELLSDPDRGLELRKAVKTRLERQMKQVAKDERGEPLEHVLCRLAKN